MPDGATEQSGGLTPWVARSLEGLSEAFTALAAAYEAAWGIPCALITPKGQVAAGREGCGRTCGGAGECLRSRQRAVEEAARWGEPSVLLCPQGVMLWAVPVMENATLLGGLLAARPEGGEPALSPRDVRRAAFDLQRLAEDANLTNAALLELRRLAARRESARAEAIHELKGHGYASIRDIYLVEEPALLAAIKRGDRAAAREIINRVLVGIYAAAGDRPTLLKSFLLELVVMLSRNAVESGGDPAELLGANYSAFAELARLEGEEALSAWLVDLLERIFDAIKANRSFPVSMLLDAALTYMREHLHEDLSRDEVARIAFLSPSHFSRTVKQAFGQSFTELLTRLRIDRAREMLVFTEKSLIQIGMDCGFSDQSYFTKVFQKVTGRTPRDYRKRHRSVR